MKSRIAIIGSGISGLGAAWALHREHDIVVFEADSRVGGHSNTVDVADADGVTSVDTGFIVYNEVTYPNLTRLFGALGVATQPSDMSFAFSLDREVEYGASLRGLAAQPSNLLRYRFLQMLRDIDRFRRIGPGLEPAAGETIGELLGRRGFSQGFLDDYLYPMTSAIWSTAQTRISQFPAGPILRFLSNHGLISIQDRPQWRTVSGGSRTYVELLTAGFRDSIRVDAPVTGLVRVGGTIGVTAGGVTEGFDHVVIATHSDQALRILGPEATDHERELLRAIPYRPNVAVLHSDPNLMPSRRGVWSSWNAVATSVGGAGREVSVTYWMNRLQNLDGIPLFVSLNPNDPAHPDLVHAVFRYAHPQFDAAAIAAQSGIAAIQGENNTWFAGAYMGYGFHEDGLQSGLNVAAALGSPAPWHGTFPPVSSAPPVGAGRGAR